MKVVLDTNVVVSRFLSARGAPAQVFKLWEAHVFDLLVSPPKIFNLRRTKNKAYSS